MTSKKASNPKRPKRPKKPTTTTNAKNAKNGGEVNHTPIIIDDGSLSMEFAESDHYFRVGNTDLHRATDLALVSVMANMLHTQGEAAGSPFCRVLTSGDDCVIEVVEQGNKGFTIHKLSNGHTTEIEFDHNVYKTDPQNFPAHGNRQRFRNGNRKIAGLQITVNGIPKHDCEHATKPGVFYTIFDPET